MRPHRMTAISASIYCAMMRHVLSHRTSGGQAKGGNHETQTDAKTIMGAGAGADGIAAAARRIAIPLAGAGERGRTRAKEERFDHDGQTVLP